MTRDSSSDDIITSGDDACEMVKKQGDIPKTQRTFIYL